MDPAVEQFSGFVVKKHGRSPDVTCSMISGHLAGATDPEFAGPSFLLGLMIIKILSRTIGPSNSYVERMIRKRQVTAEGKTSAEIFYSMVA